MRIINIVRAAASGPVGSDRHWGAEDADIEIVARFCLASGENLFSGERMDIIEDYVNRIQCADGIYLNS